MYLWFCVGFVVFFFLKTQIREPVSLEAVEFPYRKNGGFVTKRTIQAGPPSHGFQFSKQNKWALISFVVVVFKCIIILRILPTL